MKKKITLLLGLVVLGASAVLYAADHIDAPGVAGTDSDITDYYAFESPENSSNIVFVANLRGLLSPSETAQSVFDDNVMVEFNIDTDTDANEDLVIQCVFENGLVTAYGPTAPSSTGTISVLETSASSISTNITSYGNTPSIGNEGGIKIFAGPRDDPFFMDFAQYGQIIGGNASSFNNPGSDTFAGTNVMSVVIEVPKSLIGTSGNINTWVTSNRIQ